MLDIKKVDFFIAGTQKGGTSALTAYLKKNPSVYIPPAKEVHFFDNENYNWSSPDWSIYHKHYRDASASQLWGDATPITMWWRPCIKRLWQYNKSLRIILILRNPITRAYSHWNMEKQRSAESLSFLDAIQSESERCRSALPQQHRIFSYVDRGFYVSQIREIWRFYPPSQVLILRQEQLATSPMKTLEAITSFLEIPSLPFVEELRVHARSYETGMTDEAHSLLRRIYWHEICQLQALLGWDCSDWLEEKLY